MDAKDAIRSCANTCSMIVKTYLGDLEDADLMRRPAQGCNHLAWQMGHLISSEVQMLETVAPGQGISLPAGFAQAHAPDCSNSDDPAAFQNKATYLELFDKARAASLAALESLPEADLDQPAPEQFRSFCPTLGDFFILMATHPLMHAGQFVVVRRQAGKPIVM